MTKHTAAKADNEPIVLREDHGPVAMLVLNRPAARNSLSQAMIDTLTDEIAKIRDDKAVRVLIIAANGPGFCAGHDMKEMTARRADSDKGRAFFAHMFESCAKMMMSIVHLPKPVIAAVGGAASAAGCQLVASCDLAVASREARFATPGVDIGLFCSTPMVALSRNLTNKHAMEMLLTGDLIPAQRAYEIGLVNRVVPGDALQAAALELARTVAEKSPVAVRLALEALRAADLPLAEGQRHEATLFGQAAASEDFREGVAAFLERRAARFSGR